MYKLIINTETIPSKTLHADRTNMPIAKLIDIVQRVLPGAHLSLNGDTVILSCDITDQQVTQIDDLMYNLSEALYQDCVAYRVFDANGAVHQQNLVGRNTEPYGTFDVQYFKHC